MVDQIEQSDLGVVELLVPGVVDADVVCRPAGTELVAERRELADELAQVFTVGVAAGFGAQQTATNRTWCESSLPQSATPPPATPDAPHGRMETAQNRLRRRGWT